MTGNTKQKIAETALNLFSQKGYLGTSMNDIARELGITKAALYKHYESKSKILESITKRMRDADFERAEEYEMPQEEPGKCAEAYMHTPTDKIRAYSIAQFRHWTDEGFAASFRKMLTLEQYRDENMAELYHNYLATGPLLYMAEIFKEIAEDKSDAMQLALDFYGPMFLLYSVYDAAPNKQDVIKMLEKHIDLFTEKVKREG